MQTNNHIIIEINRCRYYKDLCRKIARRDLVDDLYQEFIFSLLTYDSLSDIYKKEWFRQFAKRIINNLYHSQTSTFYLKYRHTDKTFKYMNGSATTWTEKPEQFEEDNTDVLDFINKELEKMDWYDRELFKASLKLNSDRKLAQKTKINRNSIRLTIKKVKDRIRNNAQLAQILYR